VRIIVATCAGLVALSPSFPPPAPGQGRPNRSHRLPSYRASGRRMRVRTAAHPLARSVGLLALGPLRSEVVGESISPSIYELGEPKTHGAGEANISRDKGVYS